MIDKEAKWKVECEVVGFEYIGRGSRSGYSQVRCMVCGWVGEYQRSAIRAGKVKCSHCQITKYKQAAKDGWVFVDHFCENGQTYVNLKHECCDELVKVHASHYLKGKYSCPHCHITKYKSAVKDGWEFINHFRDGGSTYVNIKHSCGDELVKVKSGHYLNGVYDCPHCMHTHFSDPSYFYVIQVGDIIKLGISNRPDQRYTQYGLPYDSTITEHLRIPLETKRDALAFESYAKHLVKDFKIPTDIAKQVFTKAGFNECYSMESLEYLLSI